MDANVGLFDNSRETNLASTVTMVEDVLVELGHFLNECRSDPGEALHAWRVVKGSATVRITVQSGEPSGAGAGAGDNYPRLRVVAPIMTTDARVDHLKLYRRLLTANNDTLGGMAFACRQNEVLLVAERSTLDLDRSEVLDLIARVEQNADAYDDDLVKEFGGHLGGND